jgi:hypothetical protein
MANNIYAERSGNLANQLFTMASDLRPIADRCLEHGHIGEDTKHSVVACIDAIHCTTRALRATLEFGPFLNSDDKFYLRTYGGFQAIMVQQDALRNLGKHVGLHIDVKDSWNASYARTVRRFTTGHPTAVSQKGRQGFTTVNSGSFFLTHLAFNVNFSDGAHVGTVVSPDKLICEQLEWALERLRRISEKFRALTNPPE